MSVHKTENESPIKSEFPQRGKVWCKLVRLEYKLVISLAVHQILKMHKNFLGLVGSVWLIKFYEVLFD